MALKHIRPLLANITKRIYGDLLMPHRLGEYQQVLQSALDHGYTVIDNEQWLDMVEAALSDQAIQKKILVMRHDIDTDPRLALEWHRIEQSLGCRASYFFRHSTAEADVIRQLAGDGVHVSYHFEELADVAKRERTRTPAAAREILPAAQALFAQNLNEWRARFGLPMDIVCSHGDWMNRHLKMPNHTLLKDKALRHKLGIRSECYDDNVMSPFAGYTSDGSRPYYWDKGDPMEFFAAGVTPVGILTHPKAWRANWRCNTNELILRVREALQFRFGQGWR